MARTLDKALFSEIFDDYFFKTEPAPLMNQEIIKVIIET